MVGAQPDEVQIGQARGLREWQRYLLDRYAKGARTALEVGCGNGCVMDNLHDRLKIKGVDIDAKQVRGARQKGHDVVVGDGLKLPYEDDSFDLVYCSFYLMWSGDIAGAIREMRRVSMGPVLIFSEPVWSRSLCSPGGIRSIGRSGARMIQDEGGDPDAGLHLMEMGDIFHRFGTVPVDSSLKEMRKLFGMEMRYQGERGSNLGITNCYFFSVPFIWAVLR